MPIIIDSHVHVFPDLFEKYLGTGGGGAQSLNQTLDRVRNQVRQWKRPIAGSLHQALTISRHLPEAVRNRLDQWGAWLPLPSLAAESTPKDLEATLLDSGVGYALVIAHPPWISNEFVVELHRTHPNWLPVVNIPKGTQKPGQALKSWVAKGAKALKIHPSADGESVDSPRYRALIRAASDLGIPVILHTGCIHSHLLYKKPEFGQAERFSKWYENYSKTIFILAHMNFHEPYTAMDLCEQFPNLRVDTSWQPAEIIGEAARRIGADRILFGSDWPILGDNIRVGLDRINDCVATGLLNPEQAELILGKNVCGILGLEAHAAKLE